MRNTVLLILLFIALLPAILVSQISRTLSYQGVLTDSLGNPKPDNSYDLTFRLYSSLNGGTVLWREAKSLQVKRGLFSTIMGDQTPFPDSLLFDRPYWLSLQVGGEAELLPRIPLTAVGYSLYSMKSDTAMYAINSSHQSFVDSARIASTVSNNSITSQKILDGTVQRGDVVPTFTAPYADTAAYARVAPQGGFVDSARIAGTIPNNSVTSAKIANGTIQFGKIAQNGATTGQVMKWNGSTWTTGNDSVGDSSPWQLNGSSVYYNSGNVGIGTSTPNSPLSFPPWIGKKITLYPGATGDVGFGVFGNELRINSDYSGADITFGYDSAGYGFTERMRIKGNGNVGIGTTTPNAPLGFPPVLGKKITLYPGTTGDVGFGVAGNRLQIYSDNSNADVALGYDSAGTFTERFAVKANGALAVNGNTGTAGQVLQSNGNSAAAQWQTLANNPWQFNGSDVYYNGGRVGIGTIPTLADGVLDVGGRMRIRSGGNLATSAGLWLNNVDNTALSAFVGMENDSSVGFYGHNGTGWSFGMNTKTGDIKMFGKLGIGTATPNAPLSFPPWAGKKITLYPGPFGDAGLGVFANELRINSDYSGADITFGYDDNTLGFTERMRVKGNGNVGIGTSSPTATLAVSSSGNFSNPQLSLNQAVGADWSRMRLTTANTATTTRFWDIAGFLGTGGPATDILNLWNSSGSGTFGLGGNGAVYVNNNAGQPGQVLTSEGSNAAAHWETMGNIIQTYCNNTSQSSPTMTNNTTFVFNNHLYSFTVARNSRLVITFNCSIWSIWCVACGSSMDRFILRINGVDAYVFGYFNTANGLISNTAIANFMYDIGPGTYTLDLKLDHGTGTDVWGYVNTSSLMILPR